jgi:hypothetical protein
VTRPHTALRETNLIIVQNQSLNEPSTFKRTLHRRASRHSVFPTDLRSGTHRPARRRWRGSVSFIRSRAVLNVNVILVSRVALRDQTG